MEEKEFDKIIDSIQTLTTPILKNIVIILLKRYVPTVINSTTVIGIIVTLVGWIFDKFIIPFGSDVCIVIKRENEKRELRWKVRAYEKADTDDEFDAAFGDLIK